MPSPPQYCILCKLLLRETGGSSGNLAAERRPAIKWHLVIVLVAGQRRTMDFVWCNDGFAADKE
jgi:hypothetical protein